MSLNFRKQIKLTNKMLVIKLSSLAVTKEKGGIHQVKLKKIVQDLYQLHQQGFKVILVSSGAINAGKNSFKAKTSSEIDYAQACAAIGQPLLMNAYQKSFSKLGIHIAQVLLTHEDLKNKKRSHNLKNCLNQLINADVIPIINENDSVSFDEITVGDNDQLSAMLCEVMNADLLVMLTSSNGLYTDDPVKNKQAVHLPVIDYDQDLQQVKTLSKSLTGRGGMKTKLEAVRKLTPIGVPVIIASYKALSPVLAPLTQETGSLFLANKTSSLSIKRMKIISSVRTNACLKIDEGAYKALLNNASLLPIGIMKVEGKFSRGDSISIKFKNKTIAYGISEYSSAEVDKIKKLNSKVLDRVLKFAPSKVVIHKNNLIKK